MAPLAAASVWRLHGAVGLLQDPGLAPLRVQARLLRIAPEPMLALPPHNEVDDLLRGL